MVDKNIVSLKSIAPLLRLDHKSERSLQAQLRARIIDGIERGALAAGMKMPSSRKLARELGVGRNTIFIVYQLLIAEGHLISRERSGVFVANKNFSLPRKIGKFVAGGSERKVRSGIHKKIKLEVPSVETFRCPPDWQKFSYPFIEGQYDKSLFPLAEWREASRLALAVNEVEKWSTNNGDVDDEMLVNEIRTKLLPRRGITAGSDEILITTGEQQALGLIAALFGGKGGRFCVEDPGLIDMRSLLTMQGTTIDYAPVDDEGIVVQDIKDKTDFVYVTPSRQRPTGVTMSMSRREELIERAQNDDFIIIEDDFECELNYLHESVPALYALDEGRNVIYAASLSKVLAPGLRLGFLVGPPDVVAAARRLRDLMTRRPSPNNQRTAAIFLSLGHYDSMLNRLARVFEERLIALRDALNHYRPLSIAIPPVAGGTAYWVTGPEKLDTARLVSAAERYGVLIEPASQYFAQPALRQNMFRLGVTSIPTKNIRPGIKALSDVMRSLNKESAGQGELSGLLAGEQIKQMLSGATLLYKTVYGEPCTIELLPDGQMIGKAGYANEDQDRGVWRVEGEKWVRRWENWAYGEEASFFVSVAGDSLNWLNDAGERVDGALIAKPSD
ncbi:PLP-dependent aminotransferase family protein [Hyphococcus sp. DH-69]|uniref:MocR-like pyridoxine biosynthesis transcription factor PdxR n=1 Tax=Hyphococcus formosus TaxID=3143534 RepID=UPI00398ABD09